MKEGIKNHQKQFIAYFFAGGYGAAILLPRIFQVDSLFRIILAKQIHFLVFVAGRDKLLEPQLLEIE